MATFSVDIDDIDVERVLGAICAAYGYDPASGIAQDVYARSALISYIKGLVVNADLAAAQSAALAAIVVTPPGVS